MKSSTRKKVLIGAGGGLAALIVVLLVAPLFVDLNSYKPQIVSEVKKATGRDLVIEGPVSLSLLPLPTVSVTGVKFANLTGSKNPNMVEVKSVEVEPSLLALITGEIAVSEVVVVEPKIVLQVNAEGKPNWEFTPSVAEAKPVAPVPSSPKPLSLGKLVIENGSLIFSDSKTGISVVAEKANLSAAVGSIDGPYSLAGSAAINGSPLTFDFAVGAKGSDGYATDIALGAGGGKLGFKGKLSELGPNARLVGLASVSAESLSGFAASLIALTGQPVPPLPPLLAGKFAFDGGIDVSQTAFAANDFKMALAGDSGTGSVSVTLKPSLTVDAKLSVPKLNLDTLLASLAQPAATSAAGAAAPSAAGPSAAARGVATTPAPPATPASANSGGSLLAGVTAKVAVDVGEIAYNKQSIRNVALELEAKGGVVAVPKLAATLPGDMVLQAKSTMSGDPAKPTVTGDFSLVGPKLRDTLKWLAIDVSSLPEGKLTRLALKGRMASSSGNVMVNDGSLELDDVKGTLGVTVSFGVPLSVVAHVELDTVDVDSYLAKPTAGGPAAAASGAAAPSSAAATTAQPSAAGPIVGLKARIAKMIYNKETIGGVEVDVALQGDTLKLNDIKVSNLAGARLAVRGSIARYAAATPQPDIAFNFEAPDMGRVLKLAGATAPDGLGQVTASGGISGSVEQLSLRELNVGVMGYSAKATGTLTLPGAATGTPTAVGYKGSLGLNGQTIDGSIDVKLAGRPEITADLKSTALDVDKLSGGAGGAPPAARGKQAAAASSSKAIDTSPLRSIDGSFKLVAATLVASPMHLANAEFAATLKDGVLTITALKGALYGGTLALSGVVDGSKPALGFDFKGDVNNVILGDMLRSMSGSNQFGSVVKVTIDGKLSANGIAVKGGGTTAEQIKSSMAGGAQLSGYVFAGADKAVTMIGSAATGAVSGVIDNTLGTALGAVGQKGGVGVGNLLNAISLVLNRFVNRDNPISGRVDIASGVLTDKALVVQGDKSTASISTRTNLGNATTDTTINFVISEDGSAPYLITTARGALSSPSLNVARGTAKDPPGMVNTLTNAIPGVGGGSGGGGLIPKLPIPNVPLPNLFGR